MENEEEARNGLQREQATLKSRKLKRKSEVYHFNYLIDTCVLFLLSWITRKKMKFLNAN